MPGNSPIAPYCALVDGEFCIPERFTGAAAVADVDGDGFADIYLTRRDGPDRLMHNEGDGTFVDIAEAPGLDPDIVTFARTMMTPGSTMT